MTAPLRSGEPVTVNVALADRSYDIVIGRGLLASLGARIAKLRSGARTVSSPMKRWRSFIRPRQKARSSRPGSRRLRPLYRQAKARKITRRSRESAKRSSPPGSSVMTSSSRSAAESSAISPGLPRPRRGGSTSCKSRPLCWRKSIPPSAARPASIRPKARTWSASSISPCSSSPTPTCSTRCRTRIRAGYAEIAKAALIGDAAFFGWWSELAGRARRRARQPEHAIAVPPRQGGIVAPRARNRRARAAQSRPHLRPRARSRRGLFVPAPPWRSRRAGIVLAFEFQRALGLVSRTDAERVRAILQPPACRPT